MSAHQDFARETWHLNAFNMCEVIVIREGADARGHRYIDGRHQVRVHLYEDMRAAANAVRQHNAALSAVAETRVEPVARDYRVAVARALYEVGRKAIEPTLGMRLCDFEQLEGRDLKLHLDYADAAIKTLRNPRRAESAGSPPPAVFSDPTPSSVEER